MLCVSTQEQKRAKGKALGPPVKYELRDEKLAGTVFSGSTIALSTTTEYRTLEVRLLLPRHCRCTCR